MVTWDEDRQAEHEECVLETIRRHEYRWTGRSPDTCAVTSGDAAAVWCGLPAASKVHK